MNVGRVVVFERANLNAHRCGANNIERDALESRVNVDFFGAVCMRVEDDDEFLQFKSLIFWRVASKMLTLAYSSITAAYSSIFSK